MYYTRKGGIKGCISPWPSESSTIHLKLLAYKWREDRDMCLEGLNKMRKGRNSLLLDHQAHLLLNCAGTPLAPKTMLHFFPTGFLKISEESRLL